MAAVTSGCWESRGVGRSAASRQEPPAALTLLSISTRSLSSIFCQSCSCPLIFATSSCIMWFSCSVVASNWTRLTLAARALLSAFYPEREEGCPPGGRAPWRGPIALRHQAWTLSSPLGSPPLLAFHRMTSKTSWDIGRLFWAWPLPRQSLSPGVPCWPFPSRASLDPGTTPGRRGSRE